MTRDEVLELLDLFGDDARRASDRCSDLFLKSGIDRRYRMFRAAAEIIRESGWRPIAEAPSVIPPGRLGWWGTEKWYEVVTQYPIPKLNASTLGYTHYCPLDKPEPPAREDSKS